MHIVCKKIQKKFGVKAMCSAGRILFKFQFIRAMFQHSFLWPLHHHARKNLWKIGVRGKGDKIMSAFQRK